MSAPIKTGSPSSPQDLTPPSKQLLNKLSLQHKHIHPPSHRVCHHHPTCISLPIATICSFLQLMALPIEEFGFSV
jgi:hypothetical protein